MIAADLLVSSSTPASQRSKTYKQHDASRSADRRPATPSVPFLGEQEDTNGRKQYSTE